MKSQSPNETNHSPKACNTVVFMGVCGSGKSVVAQAFSKRNHWLYLDADDFHPPSNVAKMASGIPLEDTDRFPWLDSLSKRMQAEVAAGKRVALACSALKKSYRDRLRSPDLNVEFVLLQGSRELLQQRVSNRSDHFMPATLLESQLQTLETPADGLVVDVSGPLEEVVALVEAGLRKRHIL